MTVVASASLGVSAREVARGAVVVAVVVSRRLRTVKDEEAPRRASHRARTVAWLAEVVLRVATGRRTRAEALKRTRGATPEAARSSGIGIGRRSATERADGLRRAHRLRTRRGGEARLLGADRLGAGGGSGGAGVALGAARRLSVVSRAVRRAWRSESSASLPRVRTWRRDAPRGGLPCDGPGSHSEPSPLTRSPAAPAKESASRSACTNAAAGAAAAPLLQERCSRASTSWHVQSPVRRSIRQLAAAARERVSPRATIAAAQPCGRLRAGAHWSLHGPELASCVRASTVSVGAVARSCWPRVRTTPPRHT